MKELYFAAGCFWGAQHYFAQVEGVSEALCGYANGRTDSRPTYEEVYTDATGFAETVRVRYDETRIGAGSLTDLFFTIVDPLSVNRQGEDIGTRYRSGVYYTDPADRPAIEAAFARERVRLAIAGASQPAVEAEGVQQASVEARQAMAEVYLAVELEPLHNFFPAEERHQNYLDKHPGGYCHVPLKTFRYLKVFQDLKNLLGDEPDKVARMAQTAALLAGRMGFFWTGFYRVAAAPDGGKGAIELVLGPFQGSVACLRIPFGKGVCGTAWKERHTIVVPDVDEFPGHIACSSLSRSEIVVPLFGGDGTVTAVLDIDSTDIGTFDEADARWLEKIASLI